MGVRSKDEAPVLLNAREVLADCHSIDPEENLLKFSVCGKKMAANMPVVMDQRLHQEMDRMEMELEMDMIEMDNPFSPMGRSGSRGMMDRMEMELEMDMMEMDNPFSPMG